MAPPQDQRPPQSPEQPEGRKFTRSDAKLIAFGVIALLAGVFIGQNTIRVQVHFVFVSTEIRLIWVFLLCIVIGAALDRLLQYRGVLPVTRKRQRKERKEQRQSQRGR